MLKSLTTELRIIHFRSILYKKCLIFLVSIGRDSSVGIATRYGLDGRGSNLGGGEIFSTSLDRSWDPHSPIKWVSDLSGR